MFLEVSHAPCSKGHRIGVPKFLWTFYVHADSMRHSKEILRADQTILQENFYIAIDQNFFVT